MHIDCSVNIILQEEKKKTKFLLNKKYILLSKEDIYLLFALKVHKEVS